MKTLLPSAPQKKVTARPLRTVTEGLPSDLEIKLRKLSQRHLCARLGEGTSRLLSALVLMILVQSMTDWLLELPRAVRAIFLAVDVVVLVRIGWQGIVRPWKERLSLPATALLVQKHFPRIHGSLIASVQLADPRTDSTEGSSHLVRNLIRQTSDLLRSMDLRVVVPLQAVRRKLARAVLLLFLGAGAFFWFCPSSGMLLARIFLLPVALPTRTVVEPVTGNLSVGAGANVELAAISKGIVPHNGRLSLKHPDGRTEDLSVGSSPDNTARFSTVLKNVRESFDYQFVLNDGRGENYHVQVFPAPVLETIECEQVWPDYTKKGVEKREATALSLLAGSVLRLKIHSTLPLKSAEVEFDDEAKTKIAMKTKGDDPKTATVEIPIPAQGLTAISISLLGTDDVRSIEKYNYPIDILPDEAPRITILKPTEESQTITPASSPVIEIEVTEDFGLKSLSFCYEIDAPLVQSEGPPPPKGVQRLEFDLKAVDFKPGAAFTVQKILAVAQEKPAWREGWSIRYWIEAVDINVITGPGVTRSYEQRWMVVSPEVKRTELLSQFRENASAIKDFNERQRNTSEGIRGLFDLIDQKP